MKRFDWILTDDDCSQYVRRAWWAGNRCYEFIQLVELPEEKYGVAHDTIDLNDYSQEERKIILDAYYDNHERVGYSDQIMAECAFETFALENIEEVFNNRADAEQFIQDKLWEDILSQYDGKEGYFFMPIESTCYDTDNIIRLLEWFNSMYYDANDSVQVWAVEYERLVSTLVTCKELLVNPKHLNLNEEVLASLLKLLDEADREPYRKAHEYLKTKGLV